MSKTYLLDRLLNEVLLKEGKYDNIKPKFPGSFVGHRVEQSGKVSEVPSMLMFPDKSPGAAPNDMVKIFTKKNPNFDETKPEGPLNKARIPITKLSYAKIAWVWDGKDWITEDDYARGRRLNPGEIESVEDAKKRLGKDPVRVIDDPNTRLSYLERRRGRIVSDPPKAPAAKPPMIRKKADIKKESYIPKITLSTLCEVTEPRGGIEPDSDTNCLDCNDMIIGCPSCAYCKVCNDYGCDACQPTHCEKCSLKLDWSGICKKCEPEFWYQTMIGE